MKTINKAPDALFNSPKIVDCEVMSTYLTHQTMAPIRLKIHGWGWLKIRSKNKNWKGVFKRLEPHNEDYFETMVPLGCEITITSFNLFGMDKKIIDNVKSKGRHEITDHSEYTLVLPKIAYASTRKINAKTPKMLFNEKKILLFNSLSPIVKQFDFSIAKTKYQIMLPRLQVTSSMLKLTISKIKIFCKIKFKRDLSHER